MISRMLLILAVSVLLAIIVAYTGDSDEPTKPVRRPSQSASVPSPPAQIVEMPKPVPPQPPMVRPVVDDTIKITMDEFNGLELSATYDVVRSRLGYPGEEVGRQRIGDLEMVTYLWRNADGSSAKIEFCDEHLLTKREYDLPPGPSPKVLARRFDEMEELNAKAAAGAKRQEELRVLLWESPELVNKQAIENLIAQLKAFEQRHGTGAGKREADALADLLVIFDADATIQRNDNPFWKLIEKHGGTRAARAAADRLGLRARL